MWDEANLDRLEPDFDWVFDSDFDSSDLSASPVAIDAVDTVPVA